MCTEDSAGIVVDTNSTSSSSSEDNKENTSPSSPIQTPIIISKGLTRRQRKNHRRRGEKNRSRGAGVMQRQQSPTPLKHWVKLDLPEASVHKFLGSYVLSHEQMLSLGYPVHIWEDDLDAIHIFNNPPPHLRPKHKFDVNAREFVPRNRGSSDSGQGSSSESDENSSEAYAVKTKDTGERICVRCRAVFEIKKTTEYYAKETCVFHAGKMSNGGYMNRVVFSCCGQGKNSPGCCRLEYHVWSGLLSGFNGPFRDFVQTKSLDTDSVYSGVFALDCEMVYTIAGMELARVTVVGIDGHVVYDKYVRPKNNVFDYNTRYSGITQNDLENNDVKSLEEVRNDLLTFINANTILIGHGLENDLRALKMVHYNVIDTAVAFPHFNGLPSKHSLKFLAKNHLGREIQNNTDKGHDSAEDSQACMELMLYRVHMDFDALIQHCR